MAKAIKQIAPVQIVGRGKIRASGAPCYGATSASEPNRLHIITWTPGGWECDCARFAFRRQSCSHVRALSARLADELRQRDAAVAAAAIGPDDAFSITQAGRAALDEWRKRKDAEAQRETAPRRVQSFPVSLLK